jgi:serine/threonine-protein kinase
VYLARDEGLGREVALKILSENHRDNPELRARFLREARAMALLSDPNVVSVYTIDEHGGRPYFAMEYLDGRDLQGLVKEHGGLPVQDAARVVLCAAQGLRAAAAKDVVHRDVKPANVILTRDGAVKLTDFGLAKQINLDPELTAAGMVVGTPDYIAPEQARGDPMDSRADIYSLGCTLYHLVTGRPPFRSEDGPNTYMAIINRHLHDPRPRLVAARADVDAPLDDLCLRMMALRPEDRPDLAEVVARLQEIVGGTGVEGPLGRLLGPGPGGADPEGRSVPAPRARPELSADGTSQGTWISVGVSGIPGWAIIVTLLSVAFFLVGLGLRLTTW